MKYFISVIIIFCSFYLVSVVVPHNTMASRGFASNVIVPQSRVLSRTQQNAILIQDFNAKVDILEQVAVTTIIITLKNTTNRQQESEVIMPVPVGSVIRGFDFGGKGSTPSAQLMTINEATSIYKRIVSKLKDPALLEFVNCNLIRSSVFPIAPNSTMKIKFVIEHLCISNSGRIDYYLPRTENLQYRVPFNMTVSVKSKRQISTIYSPTHEIDTRRISPRHIIVKIKEASKLEPGAFQLSYLVQNGDITASLFTYPDNESDGGYFMILAGLPAVPASQKIVKREMIIVIDKSGSMGGEKIQQAVEAARQVIEGLLVGERFNIIVYNGTVEQFSEFPVEKNKENIIRARRYLSSISSGGGTNIYDALKKSLEQKKVDDDFISMVFFLTDGLPSTGKTSETDIAGLVKTSNSFNRRVYTFGVGYDVNSALLDSIALDSRGSATYVTPKEDVEIKVGNVFKKLSGPVLVAPEISFVDENGNPIPGIVMDVLPQQLPDVFDGNQITVFGKYTTNDDVLRVRLSGEYLGNKRTFSFQFSLNNESARNAFVPRLWASRKIGEYMDEVRRIGATIDLSAGIEKIKDKKLKEIAESIVQLSIKFGILTEYTAFLAKEGTDLTNYSDNNAIVYDINNDRAVANRTGKGSVNQSMNGNFYRSQKKYNRRNTNYDINMNRVEIATVQQIFDRAFYKRGNRWIDSRIIKDKSETLKDTVDETIIIGSDAFTKIVVALKDLNLQGITSLSGEVLVEMNGKTILLRQKDD